MATFKCKMCGGNLNITEDMTVCECEYCGSRQTIPKLNDDKKTNLYDRANHFRRNNEYDKAAAIYEQIIELDPTDAENYWSLVLCRYGIEYVEDPVTRKRIPTVNRAQYTSIYDDDNYRQAIRYADLAQNQVYEEESRRINEIQKGILEISQKEKPFDIFICYKETDANGRRTPDSVLATDLYYQLEKEGFKVFFSRITLEDKIGTAYEPYIFAALHSAKVMVVLGTKPEYFNAVWVKNEWSRYLALIRNGAGKILVPAYRGMDPYDLPEEFSHLQAQDMGKLGFMQDLIRGIKKLTDTEKKEERIVQAAQAAVPQTAGYNGNINALLQRGKIALEDGEWEKADTFFEEVLNQNATCAEAYLGKFLVTKKCATWEEYCERLKDKCMSTTVEQKEACQEDCQHIDQMAKKYALSSVLSEEDIREMYWYDRRYPSMLAAQKEQSRLFKAELENEKLLSRARQYAEGELEEKINRSLSGLQEKLKEREEEAWQEDNTEKRKAEEQYEKFLQETDRKVRITYETGTKELEEKYQQLVQRVHNASTEDSLLLVKQELVGWNGYGNSAELIRECEERIEQIRKNCEEKKKKKGFRYGIKFFFNNSTVWELIGKCALLNLIPISLMFISGIFNTGHLIVVFFIIISIILIISAIVSYVDDRKTIEKKQYGNNEKLSQKNQDQLFIEKGKEIQGKEKKAWKKIAIIASALNLVAIYVLFNVPFPTVTSREVEVGGTVYFGTYEQDNDVSDGKEKIEWLVLEKQEEKVLLISRYALDCQPYNTACTDVTWESCSLRAWLNKDFLNAAFSTAEVSMIETTMVTADENPAYGTYAGNDTQDWVFLLSVIEAEKYFSSDPARQCEATAYARAQGAYTNSNGNCWWWLRSPDNNSNFAAYVYNDGSVFGYGRPVSVGSVCVRPALWINLGY